MFMLGWLLCLCCVMVGWLWVMLPGGFCCLCCVVMFVAGLDD